MSKAEIATELSPKERRELARLIFEMEDDTEVLQECGRNANERFLMLDLLGLPASGRAMIAERLLTSLEENDASADVEAAWTEEALRRYEDLTAGRSTCRPAEDVMRDAYRALE